ncbi:GIY-YIG nuclease family protein [Falsirhodobacter sp. 1013]|uniref:GIY-YIG nuclease family protein n=1 Tax=Falsirhodobacter sp. 1013 TaxID=3417566 RepID=UPI003EB742BB
MNKDDSGRRITESSAGPLFADAPEEGDNSTGTIYVLRSVSNHPMVAANRDLVHKIGVTTMEVEKRIARTHLQTTFLMAPVDVAGTYRLFNINRTKLENLIHRIIGPAQIGIQIPDRLRRRTSPREWFLVPEFVIDEAVQKIMDGTITDFVYDPNAARLVRRM